MMQSEGEAQGRNAKQTWSRNVTGSNIKVLFVHLLQFVTLSFISCPTFMKEGENLEVNRETS